MRKIKVSFLVILLLGFAVSGASAATIDLFQWVFNTNSTVYDSLGIAGSSTLPGNFNTAGFNTGTGLGTINITFNTPGSYNFIGFFDHEIDQTINTFFNEYGSTSGSPAAGQSWQIGNPFDSSPGNIYSNVLAGALNNSNGVPSSAPDDVSMALAWNFVLGAGQTALITLNLSLTGPGGGFYLQQTDPDSPANIYYSGTLNIQGGGGGPAVPEPATMLLLGSGLAGLIGFGRKRLFKK